MQFEEEMKGKEGNKASPEKENSNTPQHTQAAQYVSHVCVWGVEEKLFEEVKKREKKEEKRKKKKFLIWRQKKKNFCLQILFLFLFALAFSALNFGS
jgi:hypothetical protein